MDTEQAILKSLKKTLKEEANEDYSLHELRFALGIPGKDALAKLKVSNIERFQSKWSENISAFSDEILLFKGIERTIIQLSKRNITMGIVTSKIRQELISEFEPFGLSRFFKQTVCASDTVKHKPHPEPLINCLKLLKVSPDEAIYIGDTKYDFQCAAAAGVKFALALWGAKTIEGFEEADYILCTPSDILDLFA